LEPQSTGVKASEAFEVFILIRSMVTSLDYIAHPSVPEPCTEAVMHGGLQTFPTPCRNTSTLPDMELQAVGGTRAIWPLVGLIINLILSDADQSDIGFRGDLSVALAMMNVIF
jgi:hypothetical protein